MTSLFRWHIESNAGKDKTIQAGIWNKMVYENGTTF